MKRAAKTIPAPEPEFADAVNLPIADLLADPHNRRAHSPRNLDMVAAALREVGAARSIVIDEDGVVLAGNGVTAAAAQAGITRVRVIDATGDELIAVRRRGLTPEAKRALAIYDNRTAELATWDAEQLAADQADGLALAPWFTDAELTALLKSTRAAGLTDPDDVPAVRPSAIATGDLFQLGRHRLLCGDSNQPEAVARVLDGAEADLLVTDPPYCSGGFQEAGKSSGSIGTRSLDMIHNDTLSTRGYMALMRSVIGHAHAKAVYVFTDWRMWINLFDVVESCGYGVRNMIVWDKQSPGMGAGWRMQHELIMAAKSSLAPPFDPKVAQGNVIQCGRTGNDLHPTQKPVELLEKIIHVSNWAAVVIDPFTGSGTTVLACESAGVSCRAIEMSPGFCQVTIDRWEQFTGQKAVRV